MTLNHILDTIREAEIGPNTFQRASLLDRQDLNNITRDFDVDYATKRDPNDAVSVKLWVAEMNNYGIDSPVLYYKNQGDEDSNLNNSDFALVLMTNFQAQQILKFEPYEICNDSSHGTNVYDIQLYTLMTVDEFVSGCAFCFSDRSDELIF